MSEYRITKNVFEKDVEEIFDNLKEYNLSKLECSEIVPNGIICGLALNFEAMELEPKCYKQQKMKQN